jgi:hypothetical protein
VTQQTAPAQDPGQHQQAQPRRVPKREPGVPELVLEMKDWFVQLERSVAGYNALHLALLSFQGKIPEGERRKGLPIFSFKSSIDGRTPVEVNVDLKKVHPDYVPHVLVPIINAQAAATMEALDEMDTRLQMLRQLLGQVLPQTDSAV